MKKLIKIAALFLLTVFSNTFYGQTFINDLSQLITYSGDDYIHLKGYVTPGDNGSGFFVLKTTSEPSNDGTIFNSPVSGKKWFRVYNEKVNTKWFKSSASISDIQSISKAISYAANSKETVYIPAGEYELNTGFIEIVGKNDLDIVGDGNQTVLKVQAGGSAIIKIKNSSNISISNLRIEGDRSVGITVENASKDIRLSHLAFQGISNLNQCIYLFECSDIKIIDCSFKNVGYQIIQKAGFSSNNVLVDNCTSEDCNNDFIELNSEATAPSKNWIVTNNFVKNIGLNLTPIDSTKVESRFIGVTNTDGIVISNNMMENIGGDGAFHFEKFTGKIVITNNIIRNPHGKFGRVIFNVGGEGIATSNRHINFSNNLVEIDDSSFVDDADRLIYSSTLDSTSFNIRNNVFVNKSLNDTLSVLVKSDSKVRWNVVGNEFKNFGTTIKIGQNAGHTYISENTFLNGSQGVEILSNASSNTSVSIDNNSFEDIMNVYKDLQRDIVIQSFTGNILKNSSIDLSSNLLQGNLFINSNTTYKDQQESIDVLNGVQETIFKIDDNNYNVLCWVEISSGAANTVKDLVRFNRHLMYSSVYGSKVEVLSHHATGNYPLPVYTVDENGLNATISGSGGNDFKTTVTVIDIKN